MSTLAEVRRTRLARRFRQLRRSRLRPIWHTVRPAAILLFVSLVLVLGTIGYDQLEGKNYSPFDAFYLAIGLFTLGGQVDPPIPTELQIARIIAPVVTGYAVIRAVLALFRQNLQLMHIRLFLRRHVVVAGLGPTGFRLVLALDDCDYRLVAIESDANNPAVAACRDRGISVLIGDATDPLTLGRAQLQRAHYLVVACGDDRVDIDIAATAADLMAGTERGTLTSLVALDDLRLWRLLSARLLGSPRRTGFRLELFHINEIAARRMLELQPPFEDGDPAPHLMFIGLDGVGSSLVLHAARMWRSARHGDERLEVSVLSPGAQSECAALRADNPSLDDICELRPVPAQLGASELAQATDEAGRPTSVYVCRDDESEALAVGLILGELPELATTPVVVAVQDADAGAASAIRSAQRGSVAPFGVLSSALTPALLRGGANEALARLKHENYVQEEEAKGITAEQNPRMAPWDELGDAYQEENRAFADGIGEKVALAGCAIVSSPLASSGEVSFRFSDEQVDLLAEEEHRRWCESRRRESWRHGPERDDERKLHPSLVPWAELPEEEKEKDRDPVRTLPVMLAEAGFQIVRAGSEQREVAGASDRT